MKSVQYNRYGEPEVVEINPNAPIPSLGEGQVLIEIFAASINPIDYKVRKGYIPGVPTSFPAVIGGDFSGVVVKVGSPDTQDKLEESLREGDEIFGQAGILNGGSGSMAEFAVAKTDKVSYKPKLITHIEAAALPLAGISALQALETHIKLKAGEKILIHGGAGGIGTMAIQIAKVLGAYVATTVSTDDVSYAKNLGADEVIDYKNEDFSKKLSDFDSVFDNVGGKVAQDSFLVLKRGGIIVSMVGQPNVQLAKEKGITSIGQLTDGTRERLDRLSELVNQGKIKVVVDKTFLIDQAREAFVYQENKSPRGKVVIKIRI